jgi:hypothetical protein
VDRGMLGLKVGGHGGLGRENYGGLCPKVIRIWWYYSVVWSQFDSRDANMMASSEVGGSDEWINLSLWNEKVDSSKVTWREI